jgi:outer membrane protein OmpA-like peptidoglycan-associated protein
MGKNPSATINLVGSSESGTEDGKAMAVSIKNYLVNIFGINEIRIGVAGRYKPKIPSEKPGSTKNLELLREGDRRVSIESSSSVLLMEFQNGSNASLKPIEISSLQQVPIDSYIFFRVDTATKILSSWLLVIKDDSGNIQNFGPYTKDEVGLPGKAILGKRLEGNYTITMEGVTNSGNPIKKDTLIHLTLWTPSKDKEALRFSVIYEFDEAKASSIYEKYLINIVTPKIPKGSTVIIQGYTDIIGDEDYNQKLSLARANDVRRILENSLSKISGNDVVFEVYGFGENEKLAPFENKFPEGRFYNRTVVIDVITSK